MKQTEILDQLTFLLATPLERDKLLYQLDRLAESQFNTTASLSIDSTVSRPYAELVAEYLQQSSNIQTGAITLLREALQKLPVCTLSLAYRPTNLQIKELVQWIGVNLSPHLLDICYQPEIVAGMVLEYEGRRYDYTAATVVANEVSGYSHA